jgi:hypothetical protein
VTGNNTIATVTFKAIGDSGTTSLAFDPVFSYIVRSTDNVNTLSASSGATFSLKLPAPTVIAVSPATGPVSGGALVTITGSGFVQGATVRVDGVAATNVTLVNATTIRAKIPAHAAGTVNVVVTNIDGQTATKGNGFVYGAPGL